MRDHGRDNAITYKAQRDKNARELRLANAAITDMQMRQRDVAALDAKYTKERLMLKLKNDALRDDVAAGRRWLTSKQSVSQCVKRNDRLRRDTSPLTGIPLNGIISPQREADHYANNWKEPRSILMSSVDRVAHIDGQLMQLL